jgi:hypothetical protein
MSKMFASVLALGVLSTAATGCGGMGQCKLFAAGQLDPSLQGEAKEFVEFGLKLKKATADFNAEISLMAGELKVEATPDAVLKKIGDTFASARAEGKCEIELGLDVDLKANFEAAVTGKASSSEGAAGKADAKGSASADVKVTVDAKCSADFKAKTDLDLVIGTVKGHFPKLAGTTKAYIELLPEAMKLAAKGEAVIKSVGTNFKVLAEAKCAVEAVTGVKADVEVQVNFSVKAQASAKGEAKAG